MTDNKPRRMLTPTEVSKYFRVDPKTVTRWAQAGLVPFIRTPGGHRRYPEDEIAALARIRGHVQEMHPHE